MQDDFHLDSIQQQYTATFFKSIMETRSLMQVSTLFFTEYAHNVSVWAAGLKFRRATMRKGGTQRLYGEFRRHYRPDSPISGGNGERIIAALIYSNSRSRRRRSQNNMVSRRRILIHHVQGIRVTLPESSTQQ